MTFGHSLQQLRRKNGLSQQQLADQLGVSRQAVSKWELDAAKPELETVIQIGKLFHISLDELLTGQPFAGSTAFPQPVDKNRAKPNRLIAGIILFAVGIIGIIFSGFAAVWMQNLDKQTSGSWFTNAAEYLWHFPVAPVVATGGICLLAGLVILLSYVWKKSK